MGYFGLNSNNRINNNFMKKKERYGVMMTEEEIMKYDKYYENNRDTCPAPNTLKEPERKKEAERILAIIKNN